MTALPRIPRYHDPEQFRREQALCHARGYLAHELMLPESGFHYTVDWQHDSVMVVRDGDEIRKVDNICRHRQAKIVQGHGQSKRLFCPVHRWAYNLDGTFHKAPHFDDCPKRHLTAAPVNRWHGLLFQGATPTFDLSAIECDNRLSFEGFRFHSVSHANYNFNWRHFLEIYLENYHVTPMHPGLVQFIEPMDLEWVLTEECSVQKVGLSTKVKPDPVSPEIYDRLAHELLQVSGGTLPRYATIWSLIYPNIMVESYPYVRVISTIWPTSSDSCRNTVEVFVDTEMERKNPKYLELFMTAYNETALEDEEACTLLHQGRKALEMMGRHDDTVYAPNIETGVREFYAYLERAIG